MHTYPRGPTLHPFLSTTCRFRDRALKFETPWTISDWSCTLNCQKCPLYAEYLLSMLNFSPILLYDQPFSRYKVAQSRKYTDFPQHDLEHKAVKVPCIHWILTNMDQIFIRFSLQPAVFDIQYCPRHKKYEWHQTVLEHFTVKSTMCNTEYLTLRPTLTSVSLYNQRYGDNWKCTEWPQTDLEHLTLYT